MQVQVDSFAARALIRDFPETINVIFRDVIETGTLAVHSRVQGNFGNSSNKLHSRTGKLRSSIIPIVEGNNLETIKGRVVAGGGSQPLKYAILQELGDTITPKNNKYSGVEGGPYLNIPLSDNKTAAGVTRQSAGSVFQMGGFVFKSKSGKFFVKSRQGQLMFILKKRVVIPPRLGMFKAKNKQLPLILAHLQSEIQDIN